MGIMKGNKRLTKQGGKNGIENVSGLLRAVEK
jgi:hypothetical protein